MVSDSISDASTALVSSNQKNFAKRKRANRSAKLKQCKLDARREQWLSQVKNKGAFKEEAIGGDVTRGGPMRLENGRGMPVVKLEIKPRVEENIYSDSDSSPSNSPTNSPTRHSNILLGRNDSGLNFTARSSNSNGCFSGCMSGEDEDDVGDDDDGCLGDWETMADALAAEDEQQKHIPCSGYSSSGNDKSNPKQESGSTMHCQAWRPDDTFRPQSLPNLSAQLNSECQFEQGRFVWGRRNLGPVPTSCPICFEDLDGTDSSFLPCLCGFRLCLFCHKRIIEDDGRCPGCRRQYECEPVEGEASLDGGSLTFRLAHSCSMITRF